jgi:hypothetical protein
LYCQSYTPVKAEQLTFNLIQLIILIGNDFNSNSELQITIRKKNDEVPCPKKGDVTHALSEAHWQHSAISAPNYVSIICIRKQHSNHMEDHTFKRILQDKQ